MVIYFMKKLICLVLLIITTASFFIQRNAKLKVNTDLKYLLTQKDSSKNYSQYEEVVNFDANNYIKINNKKINKPLLSLKNDSHVEIKSSETNTENNSDIELLAHLIESESGQEPLDGKIAVGNVVVNRMKKNNEGMEDIIYEKNQFDGVKTENFSKKPDQSSLEAAEKVLGGLNIVPDAYYFANLNLCDPEFALKDKFIIRIGDHWFFRK